MIVIKPLNILRSDKLPSDRWRLWAMDSEAGTSTPMCECQSAHASAYDAEACQQAVSNVEAITR